MMDIRGLAYVVAETTDLSTWSNYATDVLGMMVSESAEGELLVKMDERQFRIAVQKGQRNAYVASGWEVLDQAAFNAAETTLQKAKVHDVSDQRAS